MIILPTDKLYRTIANDRPYIKALPLHKQCYNRFTETKRLQMKIYTTMKTSILFAIVVLVPFLNAASVHKLLTFQYTNCSKFIH